ncbi:hypothetical protein LXL04_037109 [Taraxacum kok-saghyz]
MDLLKNSIGSTVLAIKRIEGYELKYGTLMICTEKKTILSVEDIIALIGNRCDGVISQLTEDWGETLFSALSKAGGKGFSNMVVGYNNVDVSAATKYGVAVGNTPVM